MARQRKKHHFWRNLLILIVLFGIYLYWGNRSIETDEATFTSGALPAGFDGCRIVQLSDLHGKYFGKGNERLYSAVKAAHPEYIFVMDRDQAIGADGAQTAKEIMENELVMQTDAYKNGKIIYLEHPAVWYTAEGGITALDVMLSDLEESL